MTGDQGVEVVHLRRAGTSVLLRLSQTELPAVLHWGPDLGDLPDAALSAVALGLRKPYVDSVITSHDALAVLPQLSSGWLGRPGLSGSRAGRAWAVAFDQVTHTRDVAPDGTQVLTSVGDDGPGELQVITEIQLLPSGLLRVRAEVRNLADDVYEVAQIEPALPVPALASELVDLTGRHTRERTPQRLPFQLGAWLRESRGGRPGHDSATLLCAGAAGFSFRAGRVWGVHVAHSGNQTFTAERSATGHRLLRGGELLMPGEVRLATGETYTSPWLVGSWGEGLDALSSRIHRHLRARPHHPSTPRPILLNTWEAVYFDHDMGRLLALAEAAGDLGVERFVLDDGWFRHRRDDRAGLGDWYVDEGVYPDGLHPIVDRVHELGMEFGLWFEPEMVNLDSDLAREHPDWLFATEHGPGVASRFQHVLDLGNEAAYDHILGRVSALVADYDIAYLKWDHNRALTDAGHQPSGTPGVHAQTEAVYRMMAELKRRHPGLEIESCCGGGGRIDLGIMEYADRIWPSDCIDALERQRLQRWTGLLLPPELIGTHIGASPDHTTHRTHGVRFRAGTAMWGHFGIEWDLTRASAESLEELRGWIDLHKQLRPLLHHGDVVHADVIDPSLLLEGVVAADRSEALYRLAVVEHGLTWPPPAVTLPGLDPDRTYRVTILTPAEGPGPGDHAPPWTHQGVELTGRVLAEIGVQPPLLATEDLALFQVRAV
ncbi:Alpha-galactosidase [metagenome]|uniref:alpha-galactosidase n=1 Tax=metagenome TaxID=256318 RepID=A0A2P2BZJ2_9ZZZZ